MMRVNLVTGPAWHEFNLTRKTPEAQDPCQATPNLWPFISIFNVFRLFIRTLELPLVYFLFRTWFKCTVLSQLFTRKPLLSSSFLSSSNPFDGPFVFKKFAFSSF
jgi:hypothetical protein